MHRGALLLRRRNRQAGGSRSQTRGATRRDKRRRRSLECPCCCPRSSPLASLWRASLNEVAGSYLRDASRAAGGGCLPAIAGAQEENIGVAIVAGGDAMPRSSRDQIARQFEAAGN